MKGIEKRINNILEKVKETWTTMDFVTTVIEQFIQHTGVIN